jgi:alkaline phosphatase D
MLGYAEMKEAVIWVQTTETALVRCEYWLSNYTKDTLTTNAIVTNPAQAFTVKLLLDQVEPGQKYNYQILINDKVVQLDYPTTFKTQPIWRWRTDAPDFTMALGSCAYANDPPYDRPGTPYGRGYEIFNTIYEIQPDAMLWLGDNVYLREADWYSRTGIMYRYTHARSVKEMQPLLASVNHFAIWDDHDFGPNDSDRSYHLKDVTLEAFKLFWPNPSYGVNGQKGITTFFQYHDIDFFLLDDRYFRSPNKRETGTATIMGEEQLDWLIDALVASQAPFKMVAIGGQVLNTAKVAETYAHHHAEERAYLLQRIAEENIKNVIFLTGDRHHTELSKLVNNNGNTVYDLTVSPLTSGVHTNVEEDNRLRVPDTLVEQNNFGLLHFSGPKDARQMTMRIYNIDGLVVWEKTINCEQ